MLTPYALFLAKSVQSTPLERGRPISYRAKKRSPASELSTQIIDNTKRISDLVVNVWSITIVLHDFRDHVSRHFVEKDEIADLRESVDRSTERMQASLEVATATMGDVRDAVIALTASGGKPTVPPARRRTPKSGS